MKTITSKAFTLIELLIVIGIIALLAVTVLVALNPAEAQRKSRDAKRIKDASTIEAILIQLVDSTTSIGTAAGDLAHTNGSTSSGDTGVSQNCATGNWLQMDVCRFVKVVPLDPLNGLTRTYQTGIASPDTIDAELFYTAKIVGGNYEVNVRQESVDNISKITGDQGDDPAWFEVFSEDSTIL